MATSLEDLENLENDIEQFDLSKKKKKRKEKDKEPEKEVDIKKEDAEDDYDYMFLLDRIKKFKPTPVVSKLVVPIPTINRLTPKKVMFVNYSETLKALNRPSEHVQLFISAELNTYCSIDAMNRLVIRGKYGSKQVESILKKYIKEYIICNECNKSNTVLTKDPITRLSFINCDDCKSSRSVENIKF